MRVTKRGVVSIYGAVLAVAAIAFVATPKTALASMAACIIKCESCSCNLSTGMCDCKNCTLTGCTPT